ncbi:MAG TPA: hypothetical protein VJK53_00820 [Candidatus Paceibacterota bacterium]
MAVTSIALLLISIGLVWVLRRISAGEWFNVTYSGQIGDVALTALVLVGVSVLRNLESPLPAWLGSATAQWIWLTACFGLGLLALKFGHRPIFEEQAPEILHGFVIVPGLLYLVTTMVAVTIVAGAWRALAVEIIILVFWVVLVWIDQITGRADQTTYHAATGQYFLFGW